MASGREINDVHRNNRRKPGQEIHSHAKTQRRKEIHMTENRIAEIIVDACFKIHTILGPGLLESVYETALTRIANGMPS